MALEIAEYTLQQLNVEGLIREVVRCRGDTLHIGDFRWKLGDGRRLFVVGAGKAANAMARALEAELGDRIDAGVVIAKRRDDADDALKIVEVLTGGHPIPDMAGWAGTQQILSMVDRARSGDLFIGLISGGSSALMVCPAYGITLDDEATVTRMLLHRGARVNEINAVRRHISATNGGRLAESVAGSGAVMVNLIIHDVVADGQEADPRHAVEYRGTPVGADPTTLDDARRVLKAYNLWDIAPVAVIDYLADHRPERETPKRLGRGRGIYNYVLQTPATAALHAQTAADRLGIPHLVLTTALQGESREAGYFLGSIATEIRSRKRPIAPPCALVAVGETTTFIPSGVSGSGGPSQELALGFSLEVAGCTGCSIVALDTDGTDGPTEFAGAVADSVSVSRASALGIDIRLHLARHASSAALQALDDAIITGNTGTNVCHLNVVTVA